ncbi:MAG: EAL domain-containing protein [Candidatus Thiodiazotropha sp.]
MWSDVKNETFKEIIYLHKLISRSAHDQLQQQAAMLKILSRRLIDIGLFENKKRSKVLMDEILQDNRVFIAYGLATIDGELVITSSNLNPESFPNILNNPKSRKSFLHALERDSLTLGRTYFHQPLGQWIIPLRYAIRDNKGEPVGIITTAIAVDGDHNPWKMMELDEHTYVVVTKDSTSDDEYFTQYSNPSFPINNEEMYDAAYPEEAIKEIKRNITATSGMDMESFMQSEEIVQYEFFDPVIGDSIIDTVAYNNDFEIFTSISRKYSSIVENFYATFLKYLALFVIFNLALYYIIRYVDRIQTESKRVLEFQACHDQLTSLPNRYYLEMFFKVWQDKIGDRYSVIYLDLDNFKIINDRYGHSIGDKILINLAGRLQSYCPQDAIIVRQGGDEFIFLMPYFATKKLHQFAEMISHRLKEKISVDTMEFSLSGSIGIAVSEKNDHILDELLRKADLAMYEAKRSHTKYVFYSDRLQEISNERARIEEALQNALENKEMYMVYQPQIDAQSGEVIGVEALIRWVHPTLGMVSPEKFIPVAESSGLIDTIGDYVVDTVLREFKEIQSRSRSLRVSINVSIRQLLRSDFRSYLKSKSTEYDVSPSNLVIEITESLFIEDLDQIDVLLSRLKNDGYTISLDDFGTGYSSLSVLRKLPIDEVKIDKSFVHDILTDSQDIALIKSIIGIGQSLNIPTLAEGVEELEQVVLLELYGCELFQGYFFAKPMDLRSLEHYLDKYTPSNYLKRKEMMRQ